MSETQTSTSHCQVLIVGAGPTGLVLAAQLLARGVRTRVIDKGKGPARQSRAISIYARTLELLDTMGLAETLIAHGHQVRRLHWYAGKRTLLNLDLARNGSRYGFVLHLPQNETERLLRTRVRAGLVNIVDGDLRAMYRPGKDAPAVFALVRPDGVLAARGSRRDAHKVIDYLRQVSCQSQPAETAGQPLSQRSAEAVRI